MIIDIHHHFVQGFPEGKADILFQVVMHTANRIGKSIDKESFFTKARADWEDPTGERLIGWMDESGIDFTCLCNVDHFQNDYEKAQQKNRLMGQIVQKYSKRLMAFAAVDPRRPNARDMLKECFEEFGVKGLKYHPDYGYHPAGSDSYRLLEIVQNNRGVLLTHTGFIQPPLGRPRFSDPLLLSDLAVDFPDLKVIAAHMGMANWRVWAGMAEFQPNLYGDLAMWDTYAFGKYKLFCRELRDLLDYAGDTKVLFGSDAPVCETVIPAKNWIQLLKSLPESAPEGTHFSKDEIDGILGKNAASVLGLQW
jgi:predicted TIM-barrel fold metal-dependent hydrolase